MKPGAIARPVAMISRAPLAAPKIADPHDAIAGDADIALRAGPSGTVEDGRVADDQVTL